jgi:NADH dehydrogenase [ubiquinone] 1 alpha subcomplex assembly factor 7
LVPAGLQGAEVGSVVEVSAPALALAAALGSRLAGQGGAALFIDYGRLDSGPGGTLQAVRFHRPADILAAPGEADLTAHVDFAAFAAAAAAAGASLFGPVTQAAFLGALGIAARQAALTRRADPAQATAIAAACRRLVDPDAMGELFKVIALAGPLTPPPAGLPEARATK